MSSANKKTGNRVKTALLISLTVSFLVLGVKISAYIVTGSVATLSDAAESFVHVFAVMFVVYGYYLSQKPADEDHHYGHERVEFLAVGAEGAIIIIAGITIVYQAVSNAITGIEITNLDSGLYLVAAGALINLILGSYILRVGRREKSMMAVSNGKHTLLDVWTSGGVLLTLILIKLTGWLWIDTIVSLLLAGFIMFEAYKLLRYSIKGIMDTRDPDVHKALKRVLENQMPKDIVGWHHLRHRTSGNTTWVELHLTFSEDIGLKKAHHQATRLERKMIDALETDAVVTLHLEPYEAHGRSHEILKGANRDKGLDEFA